MRLRRRDADAAGRGVDADEVELGQDGEQPAGQASRARRALPAQQGCELVALRPSRVPQGPVQRGERVTKSVLTLMDLPGKV